MSPYSSGNMNVMVVHDNESVKIGAESESGSIGINNFEVNLDDSIVKDLKWQKIGDDYKVAKLYGELELQNQFQLLKRQELCRITLIQTPISH